MTKGVLLIAAGNQIYGQMAFNLAMGLKMAQPDIKITLAWKDMGKHHIEHYLSYFDGVIEIPDAYISRNGIKTYIRSKTHVYDLSPYDETIFIDADVIYFPQRGVNTLFDELAPHDITFSCRGMADLNTNPRLVWADVDQYKKTGATILHNISSEFMYFKKTESVKKFFECAQKFFDNPTIEYRRFDNTVPDELAFQLAMIETGIKPHTDIFVPFYWEGYEKKAMNVPALYNGKWFGYSMGGATISPLQKSIYDNLVNYYSQKFGVRFPFLARSKRDVIKSRTNI